MSKKTPPEKRTPRSVFFLTNWENTGIISTHRAGQSSRSLRGAGALSATVARSNLPEMLLRASDQTSTKNVVTITRHVQQDRRVYVRSTAYRRHMPRGGGRLSYQMPSGNQKPVHPTRTVPLHEILTEKKLHAAVRSNKLLIFSIHFVHMISGGPAPCSEEVLPPTTVRTRPPAQHSSKAQQSTAAKHSIDSTV